MTARTDVLLSLRRPTDRKREPLVSASPPDTSCISGDKGHLRGISPASPEAALDSPLPCWFHLGSHGNPENQGDSDSGYPGNSRLNSVGGAAELRKADGRNESGMSDKGHGRSRKGAGKTERVHCALDCDIRTEGRVNCCEDLIPLLESAFSPWLETDSDSDSDASGADGYRREMHCKGSSPQGSSTTWGVAPGALIAAPKQRNSGTPSKDFNGQHLRQRGLQSAWHVASRHRTL